MAFNFSSDTEFKGFMSLLKNVIKIDDKIKGENQQYNMKWEAAIIAALSSGKIDKYEYLTNEEILPSDQRRVEKQATFTYSNLGKAFFQNK